MVTKWGLSDKLGPLCYGEDEGEVFLGRSVTKHKEISDETASAIDAEVRSIMDGCYADAAKILEDNKDKLEAMTAALMQYETIGEEQIEQVMKNQTVSPPKGWEEDKKAADALAGNNPKSDSNKDVSGKDDSGKDASGKDDSGKDDSGKDDSGKDASGKDDSGKDASGKDDSGKDDSGKDASSKDDSANDASADTDNQKDKSSDDNSASSGSSDSAEDKNSEQSKDQDK